MRKVTLKDLSRPVRSFLAQAKKGNGLLVEDDKGRARYGVIPYQEATPEQKKKAWREIQRIQRKVGKAMEAQGITEQDVERVLLEGD